MCFNIIINLNYFIIDAANCRNGEYDQNFVNVIYENGIPYKIGDLKDGISLSDPCQFSINSPTHKCDCDASIPDDIRNHCKKYYFYSIFYRWGGALPSDNCGIAKSSGWVYTEYLKNGEFICEYCEPPTLGFRGHPNGYKVLSYLGKIYIGKCQPGYTCSEICPEGYYCPDGSPIECNFQTDTYPKFQKYFICPTGSTSQILCPRGSYCPNRLAPVSIIPCSDSKPCSPICKFEPGQGGSLLIVCLTSGGSSFPEDCPKGHICDRFFHVRPEFLQTDSILYIGSIARMERTVSVQLAQNVVIDLQLYWDREVQTMLFGMNSPGSSFIYSSLRLNQNIKLSGSRLKVKNTLIYGPGKLLMYDEAILVLEDSTLSLKNIAAFGLSYIVLKGSSHILDIPELINDKGQRVVNVPQNIIIIRDGDNSAAIIGCDTMPSCDSAPFLNLESYKDSRFYDSINPIITDTEALRFASPQQKQAMLVGNSYKRQEMAVKSLLNCASFGGTNVHPPSTFLGKALQCSTRSMNKDGKMIANVKEIIPDIIDKGNYILNEYPNLDVDEKKRLQEIIDTATNINIETTAIIYVNSNKVPRVTTNFLLGDNNGFGKGIPDLIKSLNDMDQQITQIDFQLDDKVAEILTSLNLLKGNIIISEQSLRQTVDLFKISKKVSETSGQISVQQALGARQSLDLINAQLIQAGKSINKYTTDLSKTLDVIKQKIVDIIKSEQRTGIFKIIASSLQAVFSIGSSIASFAQGDVGKGFSEISRAIGLGAKTALEVKNTLSLDAKDFLNANDNLKVVINELDALRDDFQQLEQDVTKFSGGDKTTFKFLMPISRYDSIAFNTIAAIRSEGCQKYGSKVPECAKVEGMITMITNIMKEMAQHTSSAAFQIIELQSLNSQSNMYNSLIGGWNDGIQKLNTDGKLTLSQFGSFFGTLDNRKKNILQSMYASLVRLQINSFNAIRTGIYGLKAICSASAYQYPIFLSSSQKDNNPDVNIWRSICTTEALALDSISIPLIVQRLEKISEILIRRWLEWEPSSQSITFSTTKLEITSKVNVEELRTNINKGLPASASFFIDPSDIPLSDALSCTQNVKLQWVGVYVTKSNGDLAKPDESVTNITLATPFVKQFNQETFLFDLQPYIFELSYGKLDTVDTLFDNENFVEDLTFVRGTPFGQYTIARRRGFLFESVNDRVWLLIRYYGSPKPGCTVQNSCEELSQKFCTPDRGCMWSLNKCVRLTPTFQPLGKTAKPTKIITKKPTKVTASPAVKPIAPPQIISCSSLKTRSACLKNSDTCEWAISSITKKFACLPKFGYVTCKFTVDNEFNQIWINGVDMTLQVSGEFGDWSVPKQISFIVQTSMKTQVIGVLGIDYGEGYPEDAGFQMECISPAIPAWNFRTSPGPSWKTISSDINTFPPGWYNALPVDGEEDAILSTSDFELVGAGLPSSTKIWASRAYYVAFKKVITVA